MKTKEKTIEQKRIEILKDVLKHIEAKRIIANNGRVLRYDDCKLEDGDLQAILKSQNKKKKQCKVCQRGAILFASVWRNNNLSVKWYGSEHPYLNGIAGERDATHLTYLNELFSIEQQMLMERAFEGRFHMAHLSYKQINECDRNFYYKYKNPIARMKAIVRNAIKNGGVFIP